MTESEGGAASRDLAARCHPAAAWAVEQRGVRVIRRDTGTSRHLDYPEAALWDLLIRRVPSSRLIAMMGTLTGEAPPAIRAWITRTVRQWNNEGWIVGGEDDG